jgi:hypothetical protein
MWECFVLVSDLRRSRAFVLAAGMFSFFLEIKTAEAGSRTLSRFGT